MDRLQRYGDEKSKKMGTEGVKIYTPTKTNIEQDPHTDDRPPPKINNAQEDTDDIEN
jgi:hypothetical protein